MMDKEEVADVSVDEVIEAIREEISDEIAYLEDYARRGEAPPHCRGYKIKVNETCSLSMIATSPVVSLKPPV